MSATLRQKLSQKNITLHLRAILPAWAYEFLLSIRLTLFPKSCSKQNTFPNYTDGEWITRKPTKDERAIVDYLEQQTITDAHILHIGIGSSHLAQHLHDKSTYIDGISIVSKEIDHAKTLGYDNYSVVLLDKYGKITNSLTGPYQYIIDNNLSGYACCLKHFHDMMQSYLNLLSPEGVILTGVIGLKYFDCGFGITETFIQSLCKQYQLNWILVAPGVIAISRKSL